MDEMTQVRDLRADAPVPDRARLAPGRGRLVDAARGGGRPQGPWGRRRFVVGAAVAAVTAVAVTASVLVKGDDSGREVTPAASPGVLRTLDPKGLSAAELLDRAAAVLEHEPPVAEPRADQWIHTETRQEAQGANAKVPAPVSEKWTRYDGTREAVETRGAKGHKPALRYGTRQPGRDGERSPRELYRFLSALPADGEQALATIRKANAVPDVPGEPGTQRDYGEMKALLTAPVVPHDGLAGLYRALATLPGGEVVDHLLKTATGRQVIALRYQSAQTQGPTQEWLIDPQTCRIVGSRVLDGGGKPVIGSSVSAEGTRPVSAADAALTETGGGPGRPYPETSRGPVRTDGPPPVRFPP
ncbi:CU044_5270 family protein [Streptomyces sp. NPDC003393]